jgi:imidazole glycerol-phosphate synthase subunit HisH
MSKVISGAHIAIVDYGLGNLFNVQRACDHAGLSAAMVSDPEAVLAADGIILPGVGAMLEAMRTLEATGLADALREAAARGTPMFGVCLGMQLLMEEGSEFGPHPGLGIVAGTVDRFQGMDDAGESLKVPHIGWNAVERVPVAHGDAWANTPLDGQSDGEYMYFVHSYHVVPSDPGVQVGLTRYGAVEFCSALAQENVFGCQFHPERSGPAGLQMYKEFARQVKSRGTSTAS